MDLNIITAERPLPVERAYILSMVINSFKGRRDVEVHLFRPDFEESELKNYDWNKLLGDPVHPELEIDLDKSKRILLESFTLSERDQIVAYLKERYANRVSAINSAPLDLPIPLGLPPLSSIPGGKTIGFIHFEQIPNYTLPFPVHGFYDLAQHKPLVEGEESS